MKDETPVMTITADGSPTLYLPTIDEHYHSVKGAVAESRHVYIDMALRASGKKEIDLFECGLGTGLNAFLSLLESEKSDCRIRYTVIEAYPLAPEQATALGYPDIIAPEYRTLFEQIHSCDWGKPINITPRFSLHKIKGDLTTYPLEENSYDVIYFDAFAPEKQPEMWSAELLGRIARSLREEGILSTYCAKGEVRRRLQQAGLTMHRTPGPPGGKREILQAIRIPSQNR